MKQETYHSSTLGDIPLSFTGRRLMQNLREAITEFVRLNWNRVKQGETADPNDWRRVSEARGELAKYISWLERLLNEDRSTADETTWKQPPYTYHFSHDDRPHPSHNAKPAGVMLARLGTDADAWARELYSHLGSVDTPLNVDTLRAWFASAIEQAKTHGAESKPTTRVIQLPSIPEDYALHIVGDMVSVMPITREENMRIKGFDPNCK